MKRTSFTGTLLQTLWSDERRAWDVTWFAPQNECDIYGTCGPFGSCHGSDSPICSCLRGFEPANQEEWASGNWTGGCVRRRQLQCSQTNNTGGNGDGFLRLPFTKVPDFAEQFMSSQVDECRTRCSGNCSCIAYAFDPNIGCMFWSNSLIDIQRFDGVGIDLYIRLEASELGNSSKNHSFDVTSSSWCKLSFLICQFKCSTQLKNARKIQIKRTKLSALI